MEGFEITLIAKYTKIENYTKSDKPLEEAVGVADNNLYKAKQKGRNRVIG